MMDARLLIIRPTSGLANVFRFVASCQWLAEYTQRTLVIVKHTSKYPYAATDFLDWERMGLTYLDEYDVTTADVLFEDYTGSSDPHPMSRLLTRLNYYVADASPIIACTATRVYLTSCYVLCLPSQLETLYPHGMWRMYRTLILKQEFRDAFAQYARDQLPSGDVVVVHVRRGDLHRYTTCPENYPIAQYLDQAQATQIQPWILCTDDTTVRVAFHDRCLTLTIPEIFQHGREALFDFCVVAHATHVIGTFGSSFSLEAFCFGTKGRQFTTVGQHVRLGYVPYLPVSERVSCLMCWFPVVLSLLCLRTRTGRSCLGVVLGVVYMCFCLGFITYIYDPLQQIPVIYVVHERDLVGGIHGKLDNKSKIDLLVSLDTGTSCPTIISRVE